jgi:3-phenylpropionate/cinnamic acid dioxygenase small subunit
VFATVQDLLARYAHFLDDRRLDECAQLFSADAILIVNGQPFAGRLAIRDWLDVIGRRPAGRHLTSNVMLTEVAEQTAKSVADLTYLRRNSSGGWELAALGRYLDEVAWDGSSCVFTRRQIELG